MIDEKLFRAVVQAVAPVCSGCDYVKAHCRCVPPPLTFSAAPASRPARITITLPHDVSDAAAEEIRAHVESKIQDGGPPIPVVVDRFPAPPGPGDSRVTLTGGRR